MSDQKKYLTAEDILAVKDIVTVEVDVPEWGGIVRLRSMSGEEAVTYVEMLAKDKSSAAVKAVLMCAVKEDGTRLFTEEQLSVLKQKSLRAINRIQNVALEINGLRDEEAKKTKND